MAVHFANFAPYIYPNCVELLSQQYSKDDVLVFSLTDWPGATVDFVDCMQWVVDAGFNTHWIVAKQYQNRQQDLSNIPNVIFVDNMPLGMFFQIYKQQLSTPNPCWNSTAGKFLFLTGKPTAPNRAPLLYLLKQRDLLKHAIYSFFVEDNMHDALKKYFPSLSDNEYRDFVTSTLCNPDGIQPHTNRQAVGAFHYCGVPFDSALYQDTSFRVISETWRHGMSWVTEKTWLTIINRHPFIVAGAPGTLSVLKSKNLRTFENYLPIPNYDNILDDDQRMQAVVTNTEYWTNHIHRYEHEIRKDIEHNYQVFNNVVDTELEKLKQLLVKIKLPEYNPWLVIQLYDIYDDWMHFYYNVKDQSWPDCYHHNQFDTLPEHIQKECIDVYNYKKRNLV